MTLHGIIGGRPQIVFAQFARGWNSGSGGIFGNKRHITVCWGAQRSIYSRRIIQIWSQKYFIQDYSEITNISG